MIFGGPVFPEQNSKGIAAPGRQMQYLSGEYGYIKVIGGEEYSMVPIQNR